MMNWTQQGFTADSHLLVFPLTNGDPNVQKPTKLLNKNTQEFRLWYAEDLYDHNEADNAGESCVDVYMYF